MAEDKPEVMPLLMYRINEPIVTPKGNDEKIITSQDRFLFPADDRYKTVQKDNLDRFGEGNEVILKSIPPPDLSAFSVLDREGKFSLFCPLHRNLAALLTTYFMDQKTKEDFEACAAYCRDRLNSSLWVYCCCVTILHRDDCKDVQIPSQVQIMPKNFVTSDIMNRASLEANLFSEEDRKPIEIPFNFTASDLDKEHRCAYFREDIGINLHHMHWHMVYPHSGPYSVVNKNRRGELFYYMHQQILARYDLERLCNKLCRVEKLDLEKEICEGYFSKLDDMVSSRNWPPRCDNCKLKDINRESDQLNFDIQDLLRWITRLYDAIHKGAVMDANNKIILLTESDGINILGNLIESSQLSLNRNFFGDLHNLGHVAISLCHDPNGKHMETFGIMGDNSTAMRDPTFYRWHKCINNLCEEHKRTLPRYTKNQLIFFGVKIISSELLSEGGNGTKNELYTYWGQSEMDLSGGLDFAPRGQVPVLFTHLQHNRFKYSFTVDLSGSIKKMGTCRIFLGPKHDERGLPMLFTYQRSLMVEMDKFTVELKPGRNLIERQSEQSSVTIPSSSTFADSVGSNLNLAKYCLCGWPDHMLIPKGTPEGYPCQLFVMISDYADDMVHQSGSISDTCPDNAVSYCGLRNGLYPDKKSMGYPMDRVPRMGVDTIDQFLTPNMAVTDVVIIHNNVVRRQDKKKQ